MSDEYEADAILEHLKNINIHFFQLVMGLQDSAWAMMGKIVNPVTGKIEKNLQFAKATIDTLIMLRDKTRGNLNDEEERILSQALHDLQLNYIDETKEPILSRTAEKADKKDKKRK